MFSVFSHLKLLKQKKYAQLKIIKLLVQSLFFLPLIFSSLVSTNVFSLESNNLEGTSLNLFGIAIHNELRNDIYIGAMFAPTNLNDYNQLYDSSITKNMSLRFIQAYSNRKVARLWKQRIAMNNEKSKWQPLTKDIVSFTKIFKRPLKAGDEINLIYIPNEGTKIYLNGSLFLLIPDPQFYAMLLNIWYGSVPPSKLFKNGIMGNNTDYLQQKIVKQYESLISMPGRFDSDKRKITKIIKKKTKQNKQLPTRTTRTNNKKIVPIVPIVPIDTATQSLVDGFRPNIQKSITQKGESANAADKETLFKVDLKLSESNVNNRVIKPVDLSVQPNSVYLTENTTAEQELTATLIVAAANEILLDKNADQDISDNQNILADNDLPRDKANNVNSNNEYDDLELIRRAYSRKIVDIVKKNRKYPRKAIQRSHEGDLIISLTLNSTGDIDAITLIQRSGSRYLDSGVLRQVNSLEPYPPIPSSLNQESFVVEIPMSFSFSK